MTSTAERAVAGAHVEEVAEGVHLVVSHRLVNWYLVREGKAVTAIDAGFPPDWETLVDVLDAIGSKPRELKAVVLTHGHIDHIGFAERAREETGATVYVHAADQAIVEKRASAASSEGSLLPYLRYAPTRRLMWTAMRTGAFRGKGVEHTETFEDGETLDVPGSPRVIFTPGHTAGHCVFHLPDRDVLFTGDALVTLDPYTGRAKPCLVAKAATADSREALRSLRLIAATGAGTLLTGHGRPWRNGAEGAVRIAEQAGSA